MIGIYRVINKINDNSYIGQSTDILRRWRVHHYKPFDKTYIEYDCVFYRAIRKYGIDNFDFIILEECSIDSLNEKEQYWINYYRTYIGFEDCKGYNMTLGGDSPSIHSCVLNEQLVDEIYDLLLNSSMLQTEIAQIYGVANSTISQINHGKQWIKKGYNYPLRNNNAIKNKCIDCGKVITNQAIRCSKCAINFRNQEFVNSLPVTKDELRQLLLNNQGNFTLVGKMFNISDNGIRKWCKRLELPTHSSDYKVQKNKDVRVSKIILMLDKDTEQVLQEFNNANEAARFLGKDRGTHIHDVCQNKRQTAYGYKWKYKEI